MTHWLRITNKKNWGFIPVLDRKKVKADDLIKAGTYHQYTKCVLGKFKEDVIRWG